MIRGGSVGVRRIACCRLDRSPDTCTHCHYYMLAGRNRTRSALWADRTVTERAVPPTAAPSSRSLAYQGFLLMSSSRHLIDLICFVADAHLATLTTGSSSRRRDLSHTDSIREFLSYFFRHELCLRRVLILWKRWRSLSPWMNFFSLHDLQVHDFTVLEEIVCTLLYL